MRPEKSDSEIDMRGIIGPDRVLPCGCHVINGAICFVTPIEGLTPMEMIPRPGRIILVDGGSSEDRP